MKEELKQRKNSILMPALVGSAVGAGMAVLFAPKSGKELRKDLKRFAANTEKQVAHVIDESKDLYGEGRKVVARAVKTGEKMYDEGAERLDVLVHGKKKRSLVVPIAAGVITGAGIALLLAPKSGIAVREDIKRIAVDTRDKVGSFIDKGKDLYTEVMARAAAREEKKKILHAA